MVTEWVKLNSKMLSEYSKELDQEFTKSQKAKRKVERKTQKGEYPSERFQVGTILKFQGLSVERGMN